MQIQYSPFSHAPMSQSTAQISCFLSLSSVWLPLHRAGSHADACARSVAAGQQLCPLPLPPCLLQPGAMRGYTSLMLTQTHPLKAQTLLAALWSRVVTTTPCP